MTKKILVTLSDEQLAQLNAYVKESGESRSFIMRDAFRLYAERRTMEQRIIRLEKRVAAHHKFIMRSAKI